ncbi:MAG: bifunctional folylpolyglutamate synthase/dihydrofolate synthase [Verrucomicrobia bacterium]|nr:bifunctional folylpolyglutamate synthase/dihydrofolate synthase [Verrucomicrobiota bacterium]
MTYSNAIQFLQGLQIFGANFGLETTFKLAALAGNPQEKLRFIHVAGTNGKGSTCAMLESIYRAAGLRVGLFTSPHLVSFRERIQVNRQLISEADVARLVDELREKCGTGFQPVSLCASVASKSGDEERQDACPTFFEFVTVMALCHFAEQKCDLVIWETGLGGRLDATNIVTPLASVITNVQFDHQQWLGDTLAKIAAEKAGIIKPRVPVITATDAPEALAVIRDKARECVAPLTIVSAAEVAAGRASTIPLHELRDSERESAHSNLDEDQSRLTSAATARGSHSQDQEIVDFLPLLGEHQRLNAALAIATVKVLAATIPVSDETTAEGLRRVEWAGRLQLIECSGQTILLDGAHNVAGAEALRTAWQKDFADRRATLVIGVLRDKDWSQFCSVLAPLATRIILTPAQSERTSSPRELAEVCRRANANAEIIVTESLRDAFKQTSTDPFLVVTGSLYLVGEALEIFGCDLSEIVGERSLNEWSQRQ